MRIAIGHVTRYTYSQPSNYSILALRLTPPNFAAQRILEWNVTAPGIDVARPFRDGYNNLVQVVTVTEKHSEALIIANGVVETEDHAGVVRGLPEVAPRRVFLRQTAMTAANEDIRKLITGTPGINGLHELMHAVRDAVEYETGVTGAHTSAAEALADGRGVCQDHAHIFIAAARTQGIPARYVNGYLLGDFDKPAEAHHAWAEVWLDGLGWIGFDPANRICPTDGYVRLATGLDARSAAPIRGTRWGEAEEALDVIVEVQQQIVQQ